MAISAVKKYLDQTGDLPADALLGHLVLFRINDGDYNRDDIEAWFEDLKLNPGFVPVPGKAVDAYKKATSQGDDFDYDLPDGTVAHVLVRDVVSDSKVITRHLVREIRDSKRRRLAYGPIGEATFFRPVTTNGIVQPGSERFQLRVDHQQLVAHERPPMQALVDKISNAYDRYVKFIDGDKARAMVREYVKYLNGTMLKDGIYFVHITRKEELDRLSEVVSRLGNGCRMDTIPLVNLEDQKDMVVEAFQAESEKALAEVVKEIAHVRGTRKTVTPEAYAKIKNKYDTVMLRATEYTRTLDVSQERTAGAAEVALDSLAELQRQMLGDPTP